MRLLGPNCLGIINTRLPLNATFSRLMPPAGEIGVISQSGAMCTSLLDWARQQKIGFSKLVSLGNGADLVESDFVDVLSDDESTAVISMYLEGVSEGEVFFDSLSRASRAKPVIVYKAGTTSAGARAASSHTGALAGSEKAYTAAVGQARATRAESVEDLMVLSKSFAMQPLPEGPRVAIVTNAGGPGIIASDAVERQGLDLAEFSPETIGELDSALPDAASLYNPVDILGDAGVERYARSTGAVLADDGVDSVLVIVAPQAVTDAGGVARAVIETFGGNTKPLICSFMGAESVDEGVNTVQQAGIPNVMFPDGAVGVLGSMYRRAVMISEPPFEPVRMDVDAEEVRQVFSSYLEQGLTQVSAEDCRKVLEAYGIRNAPYRFAEDLDSTLEAADDIGYPVAIKVASPQILHKTDVGGVALGIENPDALEDAYGEMMLNVRVHMPNAAIEGVGVQKMAPPGRELISGVVRDPQFGPLVMVGLGGIYVEAFGDVSFRLSPIDARQARQMVRDLKAYRILEGVRGEEPADVKSVEDVLVRLSQLAEDHGVLEEMDLNPLMVYNSGDGSTCVDVRITLGEDFH